MFVSDSDGEAQSASGMPFAVPDDLASMAPGPGLAALLDRIPVARVCGADTVVVMAAAYRQASHERAMFLRALLESGMRRAHTPDTVARVHTPGEFAAEEARAALVWSRRRSDTTFALAFDIFERLLMLGEAMLAGALDEPRVVAFTQWTAGLSDDQAAQICQDLLPVAAELLVGGLIDAIKRAAIAIDPDWAQRRYHEAVKGRRVQGSRNPDGSANVSGLDLPVDRAAAACHRIDTLARRCKRAGDERAINHIRADLYLGMLDATFQSMDDEDIVAHVLAHPFVDPDQPPASDLGRDDGNRDGYSEGDGDDPDGRDPGSRDPGDGRDPDGDDPDGDDPDGDDPDGDDPDGDDPDGDDPGGRDPGGRDPGGRDPGGRDPGDGRDPDGDDPDGDDPDGDDPDGRDPGDGSPGDGGDSPGGAETGGDDAMGDGLEGGDGSGSDPYGGCRGDETGVHDGESRRQSPAPPDTGRPADTGAPNPDPPDTRLPAAGMPAGVGKRQAGPWTPGELRVGLSTLLGLDERPAELAGWDFVPAAVARRVITTMMTAEFRWVVCDHDGYALTTGITSARPETGEVFVPPAGMTGTARGIVELQLRATDLDRLTAAARATHPGWKRLVADIVTQVAPGGATTGGTTTGGAVGAGAAVDGLTGLRGAFGAVTGGVDEGRRRTAGARLRRAIQIRDRHCTFPACRAPARYTDQDHAIDYASGGLTTDANLGCCCRRHHRLKHCGGWVITKLGPHVTVWTSALGHSYVHRAPPIMPPQLRARRRAYYPPESTPTRLSCGCAGYCACGPTLPAAGADTPSTDAPQHPDCTADTGSTDGRVRHTVTPGREEIPPF